MKILAIAADIDPENLGGAEWHFVEVVRRLAPNVEEITILATSKHNLANLFGNNNVKIININYPHIVNLYSLLFILFSLPIAFRQHKKEQPTLIWAKQEFPQGVVAGVLKLFTKTPIYLTCQSARLHKDELVIKGRMPGFLKDWLSNQAEPFLSYAFRNADVVGAVSRFSGENAKKLGARKIEIVPNGVDLSDFKFKGSKNMTNLKIITTSSLIYRNGIDILLHAVSLLPSRMTWSLQIAGSGPEEENYKRQAKTLGITTRVKFLGRVKNTEIPKLLNSSNVFIRLSRAEGFGTSFLEAMAAGVPVIATNAGGITDFLKDKANGLVVPVENPEAAKEALLTLYKNPKLKFQMVKKARQTVMKSYNWETIAAKVLKIMQSV